jgi:hypothetical protein
VDVLFILYKSLLFQPPGTWASLGAAFKETSEALQIWKISIAWNGCKEKI